MCILLMYLHLYFKICFCLFILSFLFVFYNLCLYFKIFTCICILGLVLVFIFYDLYSIL